MFNYVNKIKVLHIFNKNILTNKNNPPKLIVEFFKEQKNIENISCFSNEGNKWRNSKIHFDRICENFLGIFS